MSGAGLIAAIAPESSYVTPRTSTTDGGDYVAISTGLSSPSGALAPPSSYVSTAAEAAVTETHYVSTRVTVQTTQISSSTSFNTTTDSKGRQTTITTVLPVTKVKTTTSATVLAVKTFKELQRVTTWPLWKVFVGGYLPVISAIIFRVFWTSIYNKVKLIEPFTRLARFEGAVAAESLDTYYLSTNLTPDPLISFFKGHWLIFWASVVYTVTALILALSTEAVFVDTNYQCANPATGDNLCWPPQLSVDPVVIRWL